MYTRMNSVCTLYMLTTLVVHFYDLCIGTHYWCTCNIAYAPCAYIVRCTDMSLNSPRLANVDSLTVTLPAAVMQSYKRGNHPTIRDLG